MRKFRGVAALVAASLVLGTVIAVVRDVVDPTPAAAVRATGGAARFTSIEWFSWGSRGAAIPAGGTTRTESYTVAGQTLAITCTLGALSGGGLVSYVPGSWQGDGFDELYNIGGNNSANTMAVGLANATSGTTVTTTFSCSATLGGVAFPLAGLVMADAEQSGSAEYVGATISTSATWRILDRYRTSGCTSETYARRTVSGSANRLELYGDVNGALCSAGPMAVAFMDGATSATNVTISGSGISAIALGVALSFDFGDAPSSYGQAGAALQFGYSGGELPVTTGSLAQNRGTPVYGSVTLANTAQPSPRLGGTVDPELAQQYSSDASGDDANGDASQGGPDDENGVSLPSQTVVTPGSTTTISGISCTGTGSVAGWIDWNLNGTFDSGEVSTNTPACPSGGGTVDLTFSVPSSVLPSGGTLSTFLRLRIATSTSQLTATGVSTGGEVEDHRIVFTTPPRLTLKKTVDARVSAADQFTVTASGTGLPGGTVSASTTGTGTSATTAANLVQTSTTYTLTDAMAAGSTNPISDYVPKIACVDAANSNATVTTSGSGPSWTVTGLANGQNVVCTITNTPRPAAISVTKSPGTATGPDADGQYTVSYLVKVSNTGALSGTYGVLRDQPSFASNLVVDGATWTTSGTGVPAGGSATGTGPFTLAPANTALARDTTHTYNLTVRFHYTNRTTATACNDSAGNGLFNRVSLPAGQEATTTDDNAACVAPPAAPTPKLDFDKAAGPIQDMDGNGTDVGDRITYTFTVTNSGNVTVKNLAVSDSLMSVSCPVTQLLPAASTTCTVNYLLTQSDVDAGAVNNTASAAGTDTNGVAVTSPKDSTSTTWTPASGLTLDKQAAAPVDSNGNGRIDAGDKITYTFTVTNSGNSTVTGVNVVDNMLTSTISCTPTTLAPGTSASCTTTAYVITPANMDAGSVSNTAQAFATRPGGGQVASNTDTTSTSLLAVPGLKLVKTAGTPVDTNHSGITDAGDTITYSFTVTNTGNVTITNLAIDDQRLTGLSCVATTLAAGASTTCSANAYTVTTADETDGAAVNRATVSGTAAGGGGMVKSPEASTSTPVTVPRPRLQFDKVAGTPVDVNHSGLTDAGDTIAYTFTVTNAGNVPVTGVTVSDSKLSATPISCTPSALAVGASASCGPVTYTVTTADESAGAVSNSATAGATAPSGASVTSPPDATSTPATVPTPSLKLVKTAGSPVDTNHSGLTDAGDTITYTFSVTNTGNVPVSAISVADTKLSATPISCSPSTLNPGQSASCGPRTYTVTTADETAGQVANSATSSGTDPNGKAVTSSPSTTTTPTTVPAPALKLVKTAGTPVDTNGSGITDAGDTISYSFAVTNTGNVPIAAVAVTDTRVSATPISCTPATVPAGGTASCGPVTYTVTAADVTAGSVANSATAGGTDPNGTAVTSLPSTTTTPTTAPRPAMILGKTAGTPTDVNNSGITDAGDTITYSFTIRNTGNVPLTSLAVSDSKLAAAGITISCPSGTLAPGLTATCTTSAAYVVTAADVTAGAVANTATATGRAPGNVRVDAGPASTSTPTTVPDPRLVLDKTAGTPVDTNHSGITDAGDTIAYTFGVRNDGNVPITAISVTDAKLAGQGITVSCSPTTLQPNATAVCTPSGVYTVTAADVASGSVENTATASGTDPDNDRITSAPDSTSTTTTAPRPALKLVKSAGTPVDTNLSGITDAGDTIAYTFTVTNTGNVPVSGVAVSDPKLTGQGITITCTPTTLTPNESAACGISKPYVVTTADEQTGKAANTATADATNPDGGSVTSPPSSTSTTVTKPRPLLTLDKVAGSPVDVNGSGITDAGDTITYTFSVTNSGNVPVSAIAVSDQRLADQGITITCAPAVLAPTAVATCTTSAAYRVTEADEQAGAAVNSATASGTNPDGGAVTSPPDGTTTTVTVPQPLLSLEKSAAAPVDANGSGITDAGDTITYSFTVTNDGNVPVTGLAVNDSLLAAAGILVNCPVTTLAPHASTTCTADPYVVTTDDEDAGQVANEATAQAVDPDGGAVTSPKDSTSTPTTVPAASLTVEKTAGTPVDTNGSGITDAGDTVVYSFLVTNVGNVPVRSIAIDDQLLDGLTITCGATRLDPGEHTTCTSEPYVVTEDDEDAGVVANTATAQGIDPDGDPVTSPEDAASVPVTKPQPALTIDKHAGTPVDANGSGITDAGDTIVYTFTVTNTGNVPLISVDVDDQRLGATVSCPPGTLAPGNAITCTASAYTVTAADVAAGAVLNTATATGTDPDGGAISSDPDTATVTTTTPRPALSIDKHAGTPVDTNHSGITDAGDTIAYTFDVTNTGNVPVTGLSVLDPKLTAQAGLTISCPAGSLAPGATVQCTASAAYVVTAADVAAGVVTNTARARGTNPDGGTVTSSPDSTTTTTTAPQPKLVLHKVVGQVVDTNASGITDAGDTIRYSFTVDNVGNVPVSAIAISDLKLTAQAGLTIACTPTTLNPGASATCTPSAVYVVTAADVAAGAVANTATAGGSDPDGHAVSSAPDATSTPTVRPQPGLLIDKTAAAPVDVNSSGITDAGDTIRYSFTVQNVGNVPVSTVGVSDSKLTAAGITITCAPARLLPGGVATCSTSTVYTVTAADVAAGSVANSAVATGTDPDGGAVGSDPDTTSTATTLPQPSLTVKKTAGAVQDLDGNGPDQGDTITYTFTVTNNGNVPLSVIRVHDALLSASPIACDTILTLAPSQSGVCTSRTYTVLQADLDRTSIYNTSTATGTDPDGGTVTSPPSDTSTPLTTAPALHLVKSVDRVEDVNNSGITDAGDLVWYTYVITNPGNVTIGTISIDDPLLGDITITCSAGSIAPGDTVTCAADEGQTVTPDQVAAGHVVNVATAEGLAPGGVEVTSPPSTTSVATTTPAPALDIEKHAATPVDTNASGITDAGDTIAYTFTVTNTGNVPVDHIAVDDQLLAAAGIGITCDDALLLPGEFTECAAERAYVVTAADVTAGGAANSATGTGTNPDGGTVTSPPDATSTPTTTPQPGIGLTKAAGTPVDTNGSGITDAGDTVAYTFTVHNTGNVPLSGATVTDEKLAAAGITISCPAVVPVGESRTCTTSGVYTVSADDVAAGTVANTATASAKDPDGGTVTSPEARTSTPTTTPAPALELAKDVAQVTDVNGSGLTDAGDTIAYTFTVTNTGNVPIADITVADPKLVAGGVTIDCSVTPDAPLAPGLSRDCTVSGPYVVTEADEQELSVANVATAAGTDPDGNPVTSPEARTDTTTTVPAPSLTLAKSVAGVTDTNGSGITDAGDTISYAFTVTNTGNVPISGVTVVDDKLAGQASPAITITCPGAPLAPGASVDCTASADYVVTALDVASGSVANSAIVKGTDPDDDPVTSPPSTTSTTTTVPAPSMVLDKAVASVTDANGSGITDAGDTIAYTFTVTNTGNVPLAGVVVKDEKLTSGGVSVTCPAIIPVNTTVACTVSGPYVVTGADEQAGSVANTATATATDPDGGTVTSPKDTTSTATTVPAPSLQLVKSVTGVDDVNDSGITDAPDEITYSFTVTNTGNVPISTVAIHDDLLEQAGLTITCTPTTLGPNGVATCTPSGPYVVTAADEAGGSVVNVATATGTDPDGDPVTSPESGTSTSTTKPYAGLVMTKAVDTVVDTNSSLLVDAPDEVTYTFTVTNSGNVPVHGITVADTLLAGQGITVTCTPTTLAPGDSASCTQSAPYVISTADENAGSVVNIATADGTDPDGDPVTSPPARATVATTLPQPGLDLVKTATASDNNGSHLTDAGDTIVYTFTVTNTGNVPLTGVVIDDSLLAAAGVAVTCDPADIAVGAQTTCTSGAYTVTEADEGAGSVTNIATASASDPDGDPVTSGPARTTTATSVPAASFVLDKSAEYADSNGSGRADEGDTILFTFILTNTGNVPLSTIVVDDQLAGPVTCVATSLEPGESTTCAADAAYVVTQDDVDAGAVDNTASASAPDPDDAIVTTPPDSTSTTLDREPGLTLVKTADLEDTDGDGRAQAGEVIHYSFLVTNTGNVRVTEIVVDDSLLAAAGEAVTCPATELDPGASMTCTADHVVTRSEAAGKQIVNSATAIGATAAGVVDSAEATATVPGSPSDVLAYTGAAPLAAMGLGLAVVAGGVLMLVVSRRRRDEG
ncbi:MAG: CshA/CshB family fibrillar adhesin-related protein [Actinobacteria bacterium]|nr:CshA/CshB family fibrillar adhesin-related protein [Actinomycetota bacterium]